MRYLHAMVRIGNIEESLNFYCTLLGMKEVRRYDSEKGRYTNIFLAAADDVERAHESATPILELTYNWPASAGGETEEYTRGRNFGHLAYEVENIYETCNRLQEHGIVINRPPRDGRMAFIRSPDGISLELLQKGDALPQAEPWVSMENTGTW